MHDNPENNVSKSFSNFIYLLSLPFVRVCGRRHQHFVGRLNRSALACGFEQVWHNSRHV